MIHITLVYMIISNKSIFCFMIIKFHMQYRNYFKIQVNIYSFGSSARASSRKTPRVKERAKVVHELYPCPDSRRARARAWHQTAPYLPKRTKRSLRACVRACVCPIAPPLCCIDLFIHCVTYIRDDRRMIACVARALGCGDPTAGRVSSAAAAIGGDTAAVILEVADTTGRMEEGGSVQRAGKTRIDCAAQETVDDATARGAEEDEGGSGQDEDHARQQQATPEDVRVPGQVLNGDDGSGDLKAGDTDAVAAASLIRSSAGASTCAELNIVWARVKGSPWWPAQRVGESSDFHIELAEERAAASEHEKKKVLYQFFGGATHAWLVVAEPGESPTPHSRRKRSKGSGGTVVSWAKGLEAGFLSKVRKTKAFNLALEEVGGIVSSSVASLPVEWPCPWWNNPLPTEESEDTIGEEEEEGGGQEETGRGMRAKVKRERQREQIWPAEPMNLAAIVCRTAPNQFVLPDWLRASVPAPAYGKINQNVLHPSVGARKKISKDEVQVCYCEPCATSPRFSLQSLAGNNGDGVRCPVATGAASGSDSAGPIDVNGRGAAQQQQQQHRANDGKSRGGRFMKRGMDDDEKENSKRGGGSGDVTEEEEERMKVLIAQLHEGKPRFSCGAGCLNRNTRLVCHPTMCPAGAACSNLAFHRLRSPKVKVVLTERCGWGVVTMETILPGQFIVEYVGEIISDAECESRLLEAKRTSDSNFYMMQLSRDQVIDAKRKGNFSRLINSSCQPNCETQLWTYAQTGEQHVGIFAIDRIEAGTELSYDYKFEHFGLAASSSFTCQCGSATCRGTLDAQPERLRNHRRKCEVMWDDGTFYVGSVIGYNAIKKTYKIRYEDGDVEEIDLRTVKHNWLSDDSCALTFKDNYVDEEYRGDVPESEGRADRKSESKKKRKRKEGGDKAKGKRPAGGAAKGKR